MEYWEACKNLCFKSQTVFGIVETYVFLVVYGIIYGRFAKFSENERFGFTCENVTNTVRNECLILYGKANPLFALLILPSLFLFLPLSTWIIHAFFMLWKLKEAKNDSTHKFHAHHLYYGQLIVRLAIFFSLLAVFAAYFETFQVSSRFECSINTLCTDSKSWEKTMLNWVSFGAILLMLVSTLSELIWLVCARRRKDDRDEIIGMEPQDSCRVCKMFSFQFLNIELETEPQVYGTRTSHGATERREASFEDTSFAAASSSEEHNPSELLLQHGQEGSSRNGVDVESPTDEIATEEAAPSNGQEGSSRNGVDVESPTDEIATEEAAPSNAQKERNEHTTDASHSKLKELIVGKRISQFRLYICKKLAELMDPFSHGSKNWKDLARYFGFSHKETSLLGNGGNAHILFFESLKNFKPEVTLNDIKNHLENLGNRSNKKVFDNYEKNKPCLSKIMHKRFGDLTDDEFDLIFKKVACELCETDDSRIIGCWIDLASKIDYRLYNEDKIRHIKQCGRATNYSPCEAVIEILSSSGETVLRLLGGLKEIVRPDVLIYLKEEIIKGKCWETDD